MRTLIGICRSCGYRVCPRNKGVSLQCRLNHLKKMTRELWKMPKLCSLDSYTSLYSRNSLMITFKHYSGYFCSLRGPSILADRPIMVSTL